MNDQILQMREYISLAESFMQALVPDHDTDVAVASSVIDVFDQPEEAIIGDLRGLAFKLRSYVDGDAVDAQQALGMEIGMQRAADMIDNLVRRYTSGE